MIWFCRRCWRTGEFIFDLPKEEAIRIGTLNHRWQVDLDMRATKVPAGMRPYANHPIMERYPSADCAGEIRIGEPLSRRHNRFDKNQNPKFNFDGDAA